MTEDVLNLNICTLYQSFVNLVWLPNEDFGCNPKIVRIKCFCNLIENFNIFETSLAAKARRWLWQCVVIRSYLIPFSLVIDP